MCLILLQCAESVADDMGVGPVQQIARWTYRIFDIGEPMLVAPRNRPKLDWTVHADWMLAVQCDLTRQRCRADVARSCWATIPRLQDAAVEHLGSIDE